MAKILIVEDETTIRDMYASMLEEDGFEVISAYDGAQGLELIKKGEWDLLLLDIMLPKIDGMDLLRQIHSEPTLKSKPVLVVSNLEESQIKKDSIELGAKEFFVKSNILPGDIVKKVRFYVTGKED